MALGAQNIFVLDSGLRKKKHLLAAGICTVCDFFLVMMGVLGAASVFVAFPSVKFFFGVLGTLFLFYYGCLKMKSFLSGSTESIRQKDSQEEVVSRSSVIWAALAFSLLNPHVYLDTVILIGGFSARFLNVWDRVFFGFGATFFSMIWFFSLAVFASMMRKFFLNEKSMRYVDAFAGIVLIGFSVKLGLDVKDWVF